MALIFFKVDLQIKEVVWSSGVCGSWCLVDGFRMTRLQESIEGCSGGVKWKRFC